MEVQMKYKWTGRVRVEEDPIPPKEIYMNSDSMGIQNGKWATCIPSHF
jgi:hypothetical protein